MYRIVRDELFWDDRLLGLADKVYVDTSQPGMKPFVDPEPNAVLTKLPVGDYVFVTDEKLIVVGEEKRRDDLLTSWKARRLQRQLRHVLEAVEGEGVALLGLREGSYYSFSLEDAEPLPDDLLLDLIKWQVMGGLIAFMPHPKEQVVPTLLSWKAVLRPGRHVLSVLAGDDRGKIREPMGPTALAFRKLLPGVGRDIGNQLAVYFEERYIEDNPVGHALLASDDEWVAAGAHKGIIKKLNEVIPWRSAGRAGS